MKKLLRATTLKPVTTLRHETETSIATSASTTRSIRIARDPQSGEHVESEIVDPSDRRPAVAGEDAADAFDAGEIGGRIAAARSQWRLLALAAGVPAD